MEEAKRRIQAAKKRRFFAQRHCAAFRRRGCVPADAKRRFFGGRRLRRQRPSRRPSGRPRLTSSPTSAGRRRTSERSTLRSTACCSSRTTSRSRGGACRRTTGMCKRARFHGRRLLGRRTCRAAVPDAVLPGCVGADGRRDARHVRPERAPSAVGVAEPPQHDGRQPRGLCACGRDRQGDPPRRTRCGR